MKKENQKIKNCKKNCLDIAWKSNRLDIKSFAIFVINKIGFFFSAILKKWIWDFGKKFARFYFLEKCGNILIIKKTDVRKYIILDHFLIKKPSDFSFWLKHNSIQLFYIYNDPIWLEVFTQLTY